MDVAAVAARYKGGQKRKERDETEEKGRRGAERKVGGGGHVGEYSVLPRRIMTGVAGERLGLGRRKRDGASKDVHEMLAGIVRRGSSLRGTALESALASTSSKAAGRVLMLDGGRKTTRQRGESSRGAGKLLGTSKARRLGLHGASREEKEITYALVEPLHRLWRQYMEGLIGEGGTDVEAKLLSADFHGAVITAVRSRDPQRTGKGGIVLEDNAETFRVVDTSNRQHVLPKQNCIFECSVPGLSRKVTLYGWAMETIGWRKHGGDRMHSRHRKRGIRLIEL